MTNLKTLRQKTAQEANMWQPAVFDYANKQAATEMDNLIESGVIRCVYDSLDDQLRELVTTRQPQRKKDLTEAEIERDMAQILNGTSHHTYGRWVFYPWSQALVHVLPPAEFRELRLNRNHYKITPEEQARLAEKTVGIVGLSVGNAVALTIAREGACGHLKLADFDELSLSNMNRIRAGVQDIGIKKTVLAARQIFELNPYARISLFSDGLSQDNMDAFLCGAPRLDILIDECDGLRMKIALRERARVLQILVLMETSDRGMLDVERFDLEPKRPIFHGLVGDIGAADIPAVLSDEDKVKYALPILGIDTISTRLAASLVEIEKTISTWPQLSEDVTLGGAVMTAAVRRLALGQPLTSGRRFLDMGAFLEKEAPITLAEPAATEICPSPALETGLPPSTFPPLIEHVVEHAILAPSAGNCQPWHFVFDGHTVWLKHDPIRSQNLMDPEFRTAYIALGAAIENMVIAAAQADYRTEIIEFPAASDPTIVAGLSFYEDTNVADSKTAVFYPQIRQRLTNRNNGTRLAVSASHLKQLETAVSTHGCNVHWLTAAADLAEISDIMGEGDRLRFLCAELHAEMMAELRWNDSETNETRDGIDIASLEMTEAQKTALNVIRRPDVVALLRQMGGGKALTESAHEAIAAASAVGLVSLPAAADQFSAGCAPAKTAVAYPPNHLPRSTCQCGN